MKKSDLAKRIVELCEERGTTVKQLEIDLGFANAYIQKISNSLPYDRAVKIAEYLGVSPDYLMTGEESSAYYLSEETAAIAQEIASDVNLRMLMDAARDTSPEDLKRLHEWLLYLKKKERNDDPS